MEEMPGHVTAMPKKLAESVNKDVQAGTAAQAECHPTPTSCKITYCMRLSMRIQDYRSVSYCFAAQGPSTDTHLTSYARLAKQEQA